MKDVDYSGVNRVWRVFRNGVVPCLFGIGFGKGDLISQKFIFFTLFLIWLVIMPRELFKNK